MAVSARGRKARGGFDVSNAVQLRGKAIAVCLVLTLFSLDAKGDIDPALHHIHRPSHPDLPSGIPLDVSLDWSFPLFPTQELLHTMVVLELGEDGAEGRRGGALGVHCVECEGGPGYEGKEG